MPTKKTAAAPAAAAAPKKSARKATPPADGLSPKAQAMLDAHVAFTVERVGGEGLSAWATETIDMLLSAAELLPLEDLIDADTVGRLVALALKDWEPSEALSAQVLAVARAVQGAEAHQHTRLGDLMSDAELDTWLDAVLACKTARRALIHTSLANPVVHALAGDIIYRGISGYLGQNSLVKNVPGASSALKFGKSLLSKAPLGLDNALEDTLRRYIQGSLKATMADAEPAVQAMLSDSLLRQAAKDIWRNMRGQTVGSLRGLLKPQEWDDLTEATYHHGLVLRRSPYVLALIQTGIQAYYHLQGRRPIGVALREAGIERDLVQRAVLAVLPEALNNLRQRGMLEAFLRQQFLPFYQSSTAQAILDA